MTYQLKLNDFVNIIENKSSSNPDDLIHICKRYKNPKRDYLFVNKYQAKHYPSQANTTIQLFKELYEQLKNHVSSQDRILIIAFAETAPAIGQAIMHFCLENDDLN
ncbi:MAG: phosphoribosyltransferase domain-containing protein, partial [Streptococcus salivarius]